MTFNLAQTYAQFLSMLYIKCNKYLQYILNDFSELNGCFIDDIERSFLSNILLFCTQLTFDLIPSHGDIFRHAIYYYQFKYTYWNIFSMDASFYSILPSEVFLCDMD